MQNNSKQKIIRYSLLILIVGCVVGGVILFKQYEFNTPKIPIDRGVESVIDWAIRYLSPVLEAIKLFMTRAFVVVETGFLWIPWPVWIFSIGFLGWYLTSWRTGVLVSVAMAIIQAVGLWSQAMSTMSLVAVAVIFTLIVAIPIGILAARSNTFESILRPILDAMQTIPSLVYLIPAVMLLGVGKVPAILTSMVFAIPPAIRLTNLGLRQVPQEVKEAALSFGASKWQLLIKVEIPVALRTIMTGVNQSTMMAVSMTVMAAFIGAGGLGYNVIFALDRVRIGAGVEAGLAILAVAIVLDRLTQALGKTRERIKVVHSSTTV